MSDESYRPYKRVRFNERPFKSLEQVLAEYPLANKERVMLLIDESGDYIDIFLSIMSLQQAGHNLRNCHLFGFDEEQVIRKAFDGKETNITGEIETVGAQIDETLQTLSQLVLMNLIKKVIPELSTEDIQVAYVYLSYVYSV